MQELLEPAVPPGADPRQYARTLARVYEATLAGGRPPARPRPVIEASWVRVLRQGVDPDIGAADILLAPLEDVERRRHDSGLLDVISVMRRQLDAVVADPSQIAVVTDADGHLLWRDGSRGIRGLADRVGFMEGARWRETDVGSNGIGICLVVDRPVQIYTAEHYVRAQHPWTCSAAPIHDPRDGALLGVVNVTGPAPTVHAGILALVDTVAKFAEATLQIAHQDELNRLRSLAAPLLARTDEPTLVVDPHGWVAAMSGMAPLPRVAMPRGLRDDHVWVPALGRFQVDPLPGGWLLRRSRDEPARATRLLLDVRHPTRWSVTVSGELGSWEHRLSARHAEILLLLAMCHPSGRSAAELADDLFGDPDRTVTVRAEMSRLRRRLGDLLEHRPYRFDERLEVTVQRPADDLDLLPGSAAPGIRRLREPYVD